MLPDRGRRLGRRGAGRRFGLPRWQFALTATDANRFALRLARQITGRPKVLVFNWCYHGTVDETFADAGRRTAVPLARGQRRPAGRPARDHRVVEFNDLDGAGAALATATSPACSPSRR